MKIKALGIGHWALGRGFVPTVGIEAKTTSHFSLLTSHLKKLLILSAIPLWLHAQTYRDVIEQVDRALALKSAAELTQAARSMAEAAKGRNLPSLDAHISAAYLNETPTMILHFPIAPGRTTSPLPMGTKEQWQGDITLSYPLFTGFAVSATIDKARLEAEKARLKTLDLKRNLYLKATQLYSAIYAKKAILGAQTKAKAAMEAAYKKAKGLYDNGLLPPAGLYNIEAKRYAIDAALTQTKSDIQTLKNMLSYLIDQPVKEVTAPTATLRLPATDTLIAEALKNRADLLALEQALHIDESLETLAKSRYYPTVGIAAAVKKQGDTIELNGDGYTNADRSYVGAQIRWNLFNGLSDQKRIEAAHHKKLAAAIELNDYKNRIKTDIQNAVIALSALQGKLKSAEMEINARDEYYKLTQGRFDNQLASADELSRAIADLAKARAKAAALQSQIFNQKMRIMLLGGLKIYKEKVFNAL